MMHHNAADPNSYAELTRQVRDFSERLAQEDVVVELDPTATPAEQHARLQQAVLDRLARCREQAEGALRQSELQINDAEQALRVIFNSTYDAILLHERDGAIVDVNDTFLRLYGVESREEACRLSVADFSSPSAPLETLPEIWSRVLAGEMLLLEWKALRLSDGRAFDVEVYLRSISLHGRQMLLANIRDITERKQVETALRESEERFSAMANNISQLAWMADETGSIFWYNKRWYEYTGTTPEQMRGWGWQSVHDPRVLPQVLEEWQRSITSGQPFEMEFPLRGADGQYRPFLTRVFPVKDSRGQVIYWFGTNTDISEIRKAQDALLELNKTLEQRVHARTAALEAANKELEAFSYSVSHDLRAPLRSIDGFSKLLLEKYRTQIDATGQDYLRRVRAASQRMGRLIDDMLKLSRIGRVEMRRAPVNLSELAETVIAELRQREPERQVRVEVAPDLMVTGDTGLLRIVLENLLGNAWKFTGKTENARVELGAMTRDGERIYFVRDNGAGFDMSYADKLFAPFQRLHSEEAFPGTGIGLAVVQRIITRHGGRVWAEGKEGEGATIYFTLGEK
ncbi:MAG: sensor histidine kinase [Armatimonadota bacterium]